MELEIAQQPEVVQQQQIQALLANVEELTRQNEELRKTIESQNAEHQLIGENQNEEELNSQANRRNRTSGMLELYSKSNNSRETNIIHLSINNCIMCICNKNQQ